MNNRRKALANIQEQPQEQQAVAEEKEYFNEGLQATERGQRIEEVADMLTDVADNLQNVIDTIKEALCLSHRIMCRIQSPQNSPNKVITSVTLVTLVIWKI